MRTTQMQFVLVGKMKKRIHAPGGFCLATIVKTLWDRGTFPLICCYVKINTIDTKKTVS